MANEKPVHGVNDAGLNNGYGYLRDDCTVSNDLFGFGSGAASGAMRFTSIDIDRYETINFAEVVWIYSNTGASGGSWKFITRGIDEDNTADFGSNPFGRSQTTASTTIDEGAPTGSGNRKNIDVRSIMQEIVDRSGWSRYNAMGFVFLDNGTTAGRGAYANLSTSYLVYRISALPNFKPTPISVSAPAIPDPMDCGFKFSEPGENVLTATADKMYINTGKTQVKIEEEGVVTSSGAGVITIAHGLGYRSVVRVQFKGAGGSDNWVRLPSANYAGGVNYYLNSTNLYLYATASGQTFYYRISLDQIAA